jgi:hypothetical protein
VKLRPEKSRAALVRTTLAGAWRRPPLPLLDISERQLDEVTPLLYGSSAGALGWWRVRQTKLEHSASANVLRQAYRLHNVQSIMHAEKIEKVFRLLREASIEAMLAKGWAAAALYPAPPLRPYHDIDIFVRAEDFKAARQLLSSPEANDCWVDLHNRFSELDDRSMTDLFARSRLVTLGNEEIRIPGAEDHLALLAIHLLKHGAWRPLWLCDIGAAMESLPEGFDWDLCLGRDPTRKNWIICVIGLAHRLLGARIDLLPMAPHSIKVPDWLIENVLAQWAHPFPLVQSPSIHPVPLARYLRRPKGLLKALSSRWPNPIAATVSVNGKFNGLPRFPYQIGNCALRAAQFLFRLPRAVGSDRQGADA